jgi:hypothetical protein
MMDAGGFEALSNALRQQWHALPWQARVCYSAGFASLLAFVVLYWTPLGNRRTALKCLVLTLVLHALGYAFLQQARFGRRQATAAETVRAPIRFRDREPQRPTLLQRTINDPRGVTAETTRRLPDPAEPRDPDLDRRLPELKKAVQRPPVRKEMADRIEDLETTVARTAATAAPAFPSMQPQPIEDSQTTWAPGRLSELVRPSRSMDAAAELVAPRPSRRPTSPTPDFPAGRIDSRVLLGPAPLLSAAPPAKNESGPRAPEAGKSREANERDAAQLSSRGASGNRDLPDAADHADRPRRQLSAGNPTTDATAQMLIQRARASRAVGQGIGGDPEPGIWVNRMAPHRLAIVERYGGSTRTEQAVADALAWLAAHQAPQGYWDCDGFARHCPPGDACSGPAIEGGSDTGVTALALIAFLGGGHTHAGSGPHSEIVRRGLNWLIQVQGPDGDLRGEAGQGRIYSHAMATLALSEALAMTRDERLRDPAQKAIDWLANAQHEGSGGWRYHPGQFGDTSVFGWAILALHSAEHAGLRVPPQSWTRASNWLPLVSSGPNGGLAAYQPGYEVSHAMTAEALLCRQLLGLPRSHPAMDEAGDYLLTRLPNLNDYHIYYWYYGTLATFQLGGAHWQRWNQRLVETLTATQNQTGHRKGSWDPLRPFGVDGGQVFSTATSALCLEVYYRYLPLYSRANDAVEAKSVDNRAQAP